MGYDPNSKRPLNHNQAIFVAEYLKHGDGTAAAKAAGYAHPNQAATNLKQVPSIKAAIAQARQAMVNEGTYNLKMAMKEAEDAMAFAKETENANAYTKAVELRAKLNGLLIDKVAHTMVGFHVSVGGIDFSKRDGQPLLPEAPEPELIDVTDSTEDLFGE